MNQQNNDDSKVLFDDSLINEIIASNSEEVSKYISNRASKENPNIKSNYIRSNSEINDNYKLTIKKVK